MQPELINHVPLIATTRGGVNESAHYGSVIVLSATGEALARLGDPGAPMYARSSLKPLQALAMLRAGWVGNPQQVTLACASHSAEQFHLDTVRSTLADAGLDESALRNTPDLPIGVHSHKQAVIDGMEPSSLTQNCSGKHAAMVATCVAQGWDLETYLDAQHPLQRAIRETIEEVCGERVSAVTTDGCGAPLFYLSLEAVTRGFVHIARVAAADPESHEATIYRGITANPEYLGGTDRDVTDMMVAFPGLMCKDGAESVHIGAFADGSAFGIKISDGGARGRIAATIRALEILGHTSSELNEKHWPKILGHGKPVGEVLPLF